MVKAWLTPDSVGTGYLCLRLLVPNSEGWKAIFRGAIYPLTQAENWEKHGLATVDDCVNVCFHILQEFMENDYCMPIGTIIWNIASTLGDKWLPCDGSSVSQTTYPELYAICGSTYGVAVPGQFILPDLRGRGAIGSGTGSGLTPRANGQSGGAETVQLTVGQMPQHNHSYTEHTTAVVINGELVPESVKSSFAAPNTTGNSGGNQPHENMQPYLVLNAFIRCVP